MPSGRRVITGYQHGEFTLWYGQSFNFERTVRAHSQPIKSMVWIHNDDYWISGNDGGSIKYWQSCMINLAAIDSAHKGSVRDLSFCETNLKFCSGSDDTFVKIWDFQNYQEEQRLIRHGGNVRRSVDWHPTKSLVASGGKDRLVKLWDAKSGRELCSFHDHKRSVQSVKWNQNGNWLLTASNDQVIKLFDLRTLKELESFQGHKKEVTSLPWHPFHEQYFVSGSSDGSILHWLFGHQMPQIEIPMHTPTRSTAACGISNPIGHMLCSGRNDGTTKFWCRNSPGDCHQNSAGRGSGLVAPSGTQNERTNYIAKWLAILNLDVPQIQPPSNLGFQNTRKRKGANDQ